MNASVHPTGCTTGGRHRGLISNVERSFGLRRTQLRRMGGACTWVGLGIVAYNLQRMTVITQ